MVKSGLAATLVIMLAAPAAAAETGWIDRIARDGIAAVGAQTPGVVLLSTAGQNCPSYRPVLGQPFIPPDAAAQAELSACTLRTQMAEARVTPEEVVEARISLRDRGDEAAVRQVLAADPALSAIAWEFVRAERMPIANPHVRLAVEMVAISPDSDPALAALPPPRPAF